jgi:DNA modification methylase
MNPITVKISEVKSNPNNPRIIKDDKFEKLVKSIKEFPEMLNIRPIVVNADMVVLGGNMRLKACKEAGLKEVAIIKAEDLTEDQQKQFIIKDNVGFGEWDWEDLANNWDAEQLTDWGLDIPDFKPEVLEAEEDEFDVPDGGIDTDIVLGDLFEIGEHRLLCGDSTDSDQLAKLMNGQKADMVFTDPPYGVSYQSNMRTKSEKFDVLKNDEVFITDWINCLPIYSNGFVFVWTSWKVVKQWIEFLEPLGDLTNMIIWDKSGGGMGDLKGTFLSDFEIALVYNRDAEIIGKRLGSVWNINKDNPSKYLHPTQKPIELSAMAIENIINIDKIVLDLFLGSGSTMAASHQLKRKCYGMELDPKYCQVIVDRMMKLDPTLEVKRNGQKYTKTMD